MNKLLALIALVVLATQVEAGTISRTYTYTDGNTISANENNTNENTLYNEINGNLDAANIENGTILNEDIADTQITRAKFASAVQSTFTYVDTLGTYRRPVLTFQSATTVDVEANTGISNQTCVHFPDERRCVTENTASTSVNRRFIISETASLSGTKNSGMAPGEAEADNTWYALYAVKVTDVSTDFVIVGSTNTPTLARFATLNTLFGTNGWVYLGMIRNGDNSGAATSILVFLQAGNRTNFQNTTTGSSMVGRGIRMSTTAGATSLTYDVSGNQGTGANDIPTHCLGGILFQASHSGTANIQVFNTNTSGFAIAVVGSTPGGATVPFSYSLGPQGPGGIIFVRQNDAASLAMDIYFIGYYDTVLGTGYNPQL